MRTDSQCWESENGGLTSPVRMVEWIHGRGHPPPYQRGTTMSAIAIYDAILAELVAMGDGPFVAVAAQQRYDRLLRAAVYMASRNNRD
jgi:hypothetical protein